jgi:hypothetical protein
MPPCPTEYGFRLSADIDVLQTETYNLGFDYTVTTLGCLMYAAELELTGNATKGELDASTNLTQGLTTLASLGTFVHDPKVVPDQVIEREYFGFPVKNLCVETLEASFGLQLKGTDAVLGSVSFEHADIYYAQAIPEPSTYALLLLGSAGVGLMVRRKRA